MGWAEQFLEYYKYTGNARGLEENCPHMLQSKSTLLFPKYFFRHVFYRILKLSYRRQLINPIYEWGKGVPKSLLTHSRSYYCYVLGLELKPSPSFSFLGFVCFPVKYPLPSGLHCPQEIGRCGRICSEQVEFRNN